MVSPLSVKELRVVKNKAREFIKSRQIEKALIIYARILKLFPDDLESLLILGDACLVRRDRERAIKFYSHAYELASWRNDIIRRLEIAAEPILIHDNLQEFDSVEENKKISLPAIKDESRIDSLTTSQQNDLAEPKPQSNSLSEENSEVNLDEEPAAQDKIILESKDNQLETSNGSGNGNKPHNKKPVDSRKNIADSGIPVGEKVSREELYKKIPIEQLRKKISDEQVQSANLLMDDILKSRSPSSIVAEHLDDIDQLLPALIEMNIRQTRDQGRPDLAEALEDILSDVLFNVDDFEEEDDLYITKPVYVNLNMAPTIIVDGINSKESPFRLSHLHAALYQAGFNILGWNNQDEAIKELQNADYLLLHNPHCQQRFVKMLAERAGINKPTIVDFDIDFRSIPMHHPDYLYMGMSSPDLYRSFTTVLQLADLITIASHFSHKVFSKEGINSMYMPEMWNEDNELWHKQSTTRDALNIGIMAVTGQLSDIAEVRRGIVRIIREFPQTRLVVTGDADAYRLFDNLPEERRVFYPDVEPDDYPYLLSQMDIILSPYDINMANHHHSDRILMEAGIKGIPWLASPIHSYQSWLGGGILAENVEDWYFGLKKMILDPESRKKLGENGFNQAQEREIKKASGQWLQTITQLLEVV
jgi:glycosyltransferase involved in cell wall biosynthesis